MWPLLAAASVCALGWALNFLVVTSSSPQLHARILVGTIVVSALVGAGTVAVLSRRQGTLRRTWLVALGTVALIAGVEFVALVALAVTSLG